MQALVFLCASLLFPTIPPGASLAQEQFTPDTLWVSGGSGGIYQISLSRDAAGVPQSTEVSLFASTPGGLSPGLAFFDSELYYASASEGTIYRYQADATRVAYATDFTRNFFGLTSLLFDEAGDLLVSETTNNFTGTVWSIPVGGGSAPFSAFLSSPEEVMTPISRARDPRTDDLLVADLFAGKVIVRDASGSIQTVAEDLDQPAGLHVDCEGNTYISEHQSGRVTKVDQSGMISMLFSASFPEGITADAFGFFYVALNSGDIVRFDASGNPVVLANIGADADQVIWFGGGSGPNTGIPTCEPMSSLNASRTASTSRVKVPSL